MNEQPKTQYRIIPAQPGWNMVWPDFDNPSTPFRSPIVAWVINLLVVPQHKKQQERAVYHATPVTVHCVHNSDEDFTIESPDGQIHQCEVNSWPNAREWTEEVRATKQAWCNNKGGDDAQP